MVFPQSERMVVLDRITRRQASAAVDHLTPSGGTAIGTWLRLTERLLAPHPRRLRHAVLLTDGRDEHETPEDLAAALAACAGAFTCDARGIGTDWVVDEVRGIASALLGTADIVAEPEHLAADFSAIVERTMGRGQGDVALRVWAPRGAEVRAVKQVSPTLEDLTDRRTADPAKPLVGLYPLGSWGDETREYHVRIALEPLAVGEEVLAARVAVVVPAADPGAPGAPAAETRVPVTWTGAGARAAATPRSCGGKSGSRASAGGCGPSSAGSAHVAALVWLHPGRVGRRPRGRRPPSTGRRGWSWRDWP